ncbi:caspase family protein [Actinokineospora auranticolor]|uniref:Caspase domain-containing protein n=1 Tax=Actinokineospora auranticolor TaxID=155976 RepID=A0A2S6GYQ4_9PSEU|nr:caspase family protein [Actinokineospora auranticolor]PPK70363.1 caspase domain-containing protein [Actinokineospora auranticolor]
MRLADPTRSCAVLVGSAHYTDPALHDLPAVRNNVEDLSRVLTDPTLGGLSRESCHVFHDLTSNQTARIERLARTAEDLLLVYFAGHSVLNTGGQLALAMQDTELDYPDYNVWHLHQLRSALINSRATVRVLVLDTCYSERVMAQLGVMGMADAQLSVNGTYTLVSAPAHLPSLAPPGEKHTAFTGELLTLLREGIPDSDDLLSMQTVYRELSRRLISRGLPSPKQLNRDTADEFALVRNRAPKPKPPEPKDWLALRNRVLDRALDFDARMHAITDLVALAEVPGMASELKWLAANGTLPILLRIHLVHQISGVLGDADAEDTLETIVGYGRGRAAWRRLREFIDRLDAFESDDQAWVSASEHWDVSDVVASGDPDRLWGLLMAMMLFACGLTVRECSRAAAELHDLGYPAHARHLFEGLKLDRSIDPYQRLGLRYSPVARE